MEPDLCREFLKDKTELIDIDVALGQAQVLMEHLSFLKNQQGREETNETVPSTCSMKCTGEVEPDKGNGSDVVKEDLWAELFKNSLASKGITLSYITLVVRDGISVAKLKM